ncbi:MAG: metallophosphoesterase family protein [Planctomycetota bacterium]
MKRVALLADIHGNAAALRAVLDDLAGVDVDGHVLLGDYFLFGPRPLEVAEALRALGGPTIKGNTDDYIVRQPPDHAFAPMLRWYREQLGDEHLAWTAARPFRHEIEPGLQLVHANPSDLESLLITEQDEWETYPSTSEEEAARLIGDHTAALTVYGHIHYASRGELAGQQLASVGSIGMPFDGDHRAAWAIAHHDGSDWTLEHRRVEYDYEAVAQEIRDQGTQLAEGRALRILQARPVPLRTH